jgi:hypothetical protein
VTSFVLGPQLLVIRQGGAAPLIGKAGLDDPWTSLTTLTGKIAVAGNRIAVLTPQHVLWAKDGLNGIWYQESADVTSFALGPQLLVVRQGASAPLIGKVGLDDPWTSLTTLTGKIAVAGNRIAVLTPQHVLWAKDGLNGTWYQESAGVTSFALDG